MEDTLVPSRYVADLFRVDVKTVSRWAKQGKLPHVRTPGGRFKFRKSVVDRLYQKALDEAC